MKISEIKNEVLREAAHLANGTGNKNNQIGDSGYEFINFRALANNALKDKKISEADYKEVMGLCVEKDKVNESFDPTNGDTEHIYELNKNGKVQKTPVKIWLMVKNLLDNKPNTQIMPTVTDKSNDKAFYIKVDSRDPGFPASPETITDHQSVDFLRDFFNGKKLNQD